MRKLLTTLLLSGALIGSSVAGTAMALSPLPASATEPDYSIERSDAAYSETLWETATAYDMSVLKDGGTGTTGKVQFLLLGTEFYFRMSVKDATRNPNDSPLAVVQVGDKINELRNGKYFEDTTTNEGDNLSWYRGASDSDPNFHRDFGDASYSSLIYADSTYVWTCAYELGVAAADGAQIQVKLQHGDVPADQESFIDGISNFPHALSFEQTLTVGGASAPAENPEDYVVGTADNYSEDVWANASTFPLTLSKGETDSTGNVKLVLVGSKLYFRMTVYDDTKNKADTPVYELTAGDKTFKFETARYLEADQTEIADGTAWVRESPADQHVIMTTKYADGAYVLTVGYDFGETNTQEGARLSAKFYHCDITVSNEEDATDYWADGMQNYDNIISFEHTLYLGAYTETPPDMPEPPVYPEDPEPMPGPANPDYKIVIEDRAQVPRERDEDWENVPKYEMIPINGNSEDALADQGMPGATGTVQVLTSNGNIMFRVEIKDHTMSYADGRLIWFGNDIAWKDPAAEGALHFKGEGSYDMSEDATGWLSVQPGDNDFSPQPSLGKMFVDPGDGNVTDHTGDGTYVYYIGYQIGDEQYGYDMSEGSTIKVRIAHTDSRHGGESWKSDNAFHTIYFEQTLTFGKEADKTIRPVEPEGGFTAERTELAYNKVTIGWEDMDGGETYRAMVYTVNPEGSEEPYTFLKQDNTFVGEGEIIIDGLNEKTEYVVQILVLDDMDNQIGASELIRFTTPGKNDPVPPEGGDEGGGEQDDGGCGSQLSVVGGVAFTLLIGAAAAAVVLIRKKRTK